MAEKDFSLPYLQDGKFTGRALEHITALTAEKFEALREESESALAGKLEKKSFELFVETLSAGVQDSEALSALGAARAEVKQESLERQAEDEKLARRIDDFEAKGLEFNAAAERAAIEKIEQVLPEIQRAAAEHVKGSVLKGDPGRSVESVENVGLGQAKFIDAAGQEIGTINLPPGPKGDQGLPGVNSVAADEAVAAYIGASETKTSEALASRFIVSERGAGVFNLRQFTGDTVSARFENAVSELSAQHGEATLQVSEDLVLNAPLELDLKNVSIDFQGKKLNAGRIKNDAAIKITNTTGRVLPMNRRAYRNLQLIGPGRTHAGSIGIRFYTKDATGTDNARGALFENLEIDGFETGLSFGKNSYLIRFVNGHIYRCGACVRVEDKHFLGDENQNYGENIAFFGYSFGNSDLGVYLGDNDLTDVNMYACSFDFLQGGGQRMAVVKSGQLNCTDAHIEFNGALTAGPIVEVGPHAAGEVRIKGSRIQHNNVPPANVDYYFRSLNPYGSGGITITDSTLHFIQANSGYLCDGPGSFYTSNITFPSGVDGSWYGMGTVMTTRAQSLMLDPGFTLAEQADVQVMDREATTAASSPSVSVANRAGRLVITKHTTGAGSVAVTVPVERHRWYAQAFKMESFSTVDGQAPGRLRLYDRFIASKASDALGRPLVLREQRRGESAWDVTSLSGVRKAFGGVFQGAGRQPVSRKAPPWATHYQVVIPVTNLAPGEYVFEELDVTAL